MEEIFKLILESERQHQRPIRPYENPIQKFSFIGMWIAFGSAIAVAFSTRFYDTGELKLAALVLVVIAQLAAIVYQLSVALQGILVIFQPALHFLQPLTISAKHDYKLASEMSEFNQHELDYAVKRLRLEISQMKSRIGLLVGAIETVGLIPVSATTAFSLYSYFVDKKIAFTGVDWIIYAFMAFYLAIISVIFFSHKLERYALAIDAAIQLKGPVSAS